MTLTEFSLWAGLNMSHFLLLVHFIRQWWFKHCYDSTFDFKKLRLQGLIQNHTQHAVWPLGFLVNPMLPLLFLMGIVVWVTLLHLKPSNPASVLECCHHSFTITCPSTANPWWRPFWLGSSMASLNGGLDWHRSHLSEPSTGHQYFYPKAHLPFRNPSRPFKSQGQICTFPSSLQLDMSAKANLSLQPWAWA